MYRAQAKEKNNAKTKKKTEDREKGNKLETFLSFLVSVCPS